ncbi:membrane protein [Caballeronia peredens]|nr:membrane protein [Caballeronia peredens]
MKSWVHGVIAAAVLSAPFAAFAQSSAPASRAEVRAELVQLEKAGYSPAAEDATYPANLQAAEARVAEVRMAQGQTNSGYGASTGSAVRAGSVSRRVDPQGVFFGQ